MTKRCTRCDQTKSVDEFPKNGKGRVRSWCHKCCGEYRAYMAANDPDWTLNRRAASRKCRLRSQFGLTPAQYDARLLTQDGVCLVCLKPPGHQRLAVDHDRRCCPGETSCGECIRGLLHSKCNRAIGMLGDDPDTLRRAADYVLRLVAVA